MGRIPDGKLFNAETRVLDGACVVEAAGEVDVSTVWKLDEELERALGMREELVIVDMTGVTFLDSTGLHLLLRTQQKLSENGRELKLVCGTGPVRRLLTLAGVDDRLPVHDSLSAALDGSSPS